MSRRRAPAVRHVDWLALIDVSGPFLSLSVLGEAFPQGLDADDPEAARLLREGYEEWTANRALRRPDPAIHRAWVLLMLGDVLGYEDGALAEGAEIPESAAATLAEHHVTLRPDFAVRAPGSVIAMLVQVHPAGTALERSLQDGALHASPAERMRLLLRGSGVRSGLVTNGEQWMLVHQPPERTATFATWEAEVLAEEADARRALRSLLGVQRLLGVAEPDTLDRLLERSRDDEREVTDQLGAQTRRAVELMIDAIAQADKEAGGSVLAEQSLEHVYEAAVTVAMRIIFVLAAEARGLMPDEGPWLEAYAVGPLRERLRTEADRGGEELLDRRFDAWPRLLASFRAVHAGVEHDRIRMPGYGGGLFDPARYPFLESTDGPTLRISNRVMLHVLDSLQTLEVQVPGGRERRPLSFRALGVEQIGHVYEGLLDHEAVNNPVPALGLTGTSKKEPEIALELLERAREAGEEELLGLLKEDTGRSLPALRRALAAEPDAERLARLRAACDNDDDLVARITPFLAVVRDDAFGAPTVYLPGTIYVTASTRRRATGTHYTPPSLTEPIVRYALEPVVYRGPAGGLPRQEWTLKPPNELLELKVCDIAMGSAAFLVAACRYLAARLVEAWNDHPDALPEAAGVDLEERHLTARRLVAERCLYGVDKNALAVDIAKVSMWLITLRKDRPFTFVDHALRHGDSLLGLTSEQQLLRLSLRPEGSVPGWMLDLPRETVRGVLDQLRALRDRIEATDAIDLREVEEKRRLLGTAERVGAALRATADLVAGATLAAAPARDPEAAEALIEARAEEIADALRSYRDETDLAVAVPELEQRAREYLEAGRAPLAPELPQPFHWVLEFPEALSDARGGFDAIVGNPPFLGGKKVSGELGGTYREYLIEELASGRRGVADLVAFFFLRAAGLVRDGGTFGLVATNTIAQGDTREVGLDQLEGGCRIYRAIKSRQWPGEAALYVSHIWAATNGWQAAPVLDEHTVQRVTAALDAEGRVVGTPLKLAGNDGGAHIGSLINGDGFLLGPEEARRKIGEDPAAGEVIFPYLVAQDLTSRPDQSASRCVIDFRDWPLPRAERYRGPMRVVRERVLPHRSRVKRKAYRERWWQFAERQDKMRKAIEGFSRVLVGPRTTKWWGVSFVPNGWVYSDATIVFAYDDDAHAAVLSSTFHEAWARKYSGSLKFDLRYSPTDCFGNFPFPADLDALNAIGGRYLSHRKATMLDQDQGLTTAYNRLHEQPEDHDSAIVELRRLRRELDRAVANAYGWTDLELEHGFRETPLGLRYTIDEPTKIEALDRLLELNHARLAEEVARGLHDGKEKKPRRPRTPEAPPASQPGGGGRLFADG